MAQLTPLSELEGRVAERLVWDLELDSYAGPDRIGVNIPLLNHLVRLAGYDAAHITAYSGGTDKVNPGISGRNKDGTAILSGSATKVRAPRQQTEGGDPIRSGEFWSSAPGNQQELVEVISPSYRTGQLRVNRSKMSAQVQERSNIRDSAAWAHALNQALTASLRESARTNLISKTGLGVLGAAALYATAESTSYIHVPEVYVGSVASQIALVSAVTYGIGAAATRRLRGGELRWSLLPGAQLDRTGYVFGMTAVNRLVRPL